MPTFTMLFDGYIVHPNPVGTIPYFQLNTVEVGMIFNLLTFVQCWVAVAHRGQFGRFVVAMLPARSGDGEPGLKTLCRGLLTFRKCRYSATVRNANRRCSCVITNSQTSVLMLGSFCAFFRLDCFLAFFFTIAYHRYYDTCLKVHNLFLHRSLYQCFEDFCLMDSSIETG